MHAARLVAAQSALLALLIDQRGQQVVQIDGITVALSHQPEGDSLDIIYTHNGAPVAGEGI